MERKEGHRIHTTKRTSKKTTNGEELNCFHTPLSHQWTQTALAPQTGTIKLVEDLLFTQTKRGEVLKISRQGSPDPEGYVFFLFKLESYSQSLDRNQAKVIWFCDAWMFSHRSASQLNWTGQPCGGKRKSWLIFVLQRQNNSTAAGLLMNFSC